jgi:hypothetical protein
MAPLLGTRRARCSADRESPHSIEGAVRTALAAGDPDVAARLAERVEPIYPLHEHALATARALLREHDGSHAEAAELFAEAAERSARFEMPWEEAQALLGRGRCLLALGRALKATEPPRCPRDIRGPRCQAHARADRLPIRTSNRAQLLAKRWRCLRQQRSGDDLIR